jgi:hypothetical protein
MTYHDLFVMIIIGAIFLAIGLFGLIWGKKETGDYFGSLSKQVDVREYMEAAPIRPEPVAIKYGGRISLAVGAIVLIVSLILFLGVVAK